ncbi:RTA1 like family protein [Candida parapsilosis]|uniref:Sphingoid long-chain base transporter RSB1 n=1 Tax=Candida parapsilosis TaxID=5480 RepID=A0A8X7TC33_CANPA|nr:RTA1 like family protein [Candida parapsilosis]
MPYIIACDITSLVIQAIGGGIASVRAENYENADPGTYTMIAGIAFQYPSQLASEKSDLVDPQQVLKPSVKNFFKLLINSKKTAEYKRNILEPYYNPISLAIIAVFVRCIYRVVELAQGFSGYLITHEVYIMCLDALMLFIACTCLFLPPHIVFGASNIIRLGDIKGNTDEK